MESNSLLKPESTYLAALPNQPLQQLDTCRPFLLTDTLFATTGMLREEISNTQPPLQSFLYIYNNYSMTQENNKALRFETRGFETKR
jgi:hypothetical protein